MKDKQQITDKGVNWTTMLRFNLTSVNKIAANRKEITLMAVNRRRRRLRRGPARRVAKSQVTREIGIGGEKKTTKEKHPRLKMRASPGWAAASRSQQIFTQRVHVHTVALTDLLPFNTTALITATGRVETATRNKEGGG